MKIIEKIKLSERIGRDYWKNETKGLIERKREIYKKIKIKEHDMETAAQGSAKINAERLGKILKEVV